MSGQIFVTVSGTQERVAGTDLGDGTSAIKVATPAATVIANGVFTVGVSRAALSGTFSRGAQFVADPTNVADIWLGGSTVLADGSVGGIRIQPGQPWVPPDAWQDFSLVYGISTVAGQKLCYAKGS